MTPTHQGPRPDIEVRAATVVDAAAVWPLTEQFATSFTPEPGPFGEMFAELVTRDDTFLGVAERPEGVVGYVLASRHGTLFANGAVAWVEELMVHPAVRRQGIGRALMGVVEQWGQAQGAAYVALATRRGDTFYSALGYDASATFYRKPLPRPTGR
jgi:GNAT superfamily N-acetyltransferase